jgi:hypothetical protein
MREAYPASGIPPIIANFMPQTPPDVKQIKQAVANHLAEAKGHEFGSENRITLSTSASSALTAVRSVNLSVPPSPCAIYLTSACIHPLAPPPTNGF